MAKWNLGWAGGFGNLPKGLDSLGTSPKSPKPIPGSAPVGGGPITPIKTGDIVPITNPGGTTTNITAGSAQLQGPLPGYDPGAWDPTANEGLGGPITPTTPYDPNVGIVNPFADPTQGGGFGIPRPDPSKIAPTPLTTTPQPTADEVGPQTLQGPLPGYDPSQEVSREQRDRIDAANAAAAGGTDGTGGTGGTPGSGADWGGGRVANPRGGGELILPGSEGQPGDPLYEYGGHFENGQLTTMSSSFDWGDWGFDITYGTAGTGGAGTGGAGTWQTIGDPGTRSQTSTGAGGVLEIRDPGYQQGAFKVYQEFGARSDQDTFWDVAQRQYNPGAWNSALGKMRAGDYNFTGAELLALKNARSILDTGLPIVPGNYDISPSGHPMSKPPQDTVAKLTGNWNGKVPANVPAKSVPVVNFAGGMTWLAPDGNFYSFDGSLADNTHQSVTLANYQSAYDKALAENRPLVITEVGIGTGQGGADGAPQPFLQQDPNMLQQPPGYYDPTDDSFATGQFAPGTGPGLGQGPDPRSVQQPTAADLAAAGIDPTIQPAPGGYDPSDTSWQADFNARLAAAGATQNDDGSLSVHSDATNQTTTFDPNTGLTTTVNHDTGETRITDLSGSAPPADSNALKISSPELFGGPDGTGPVQVADDVFQYPDMTDPNFLQARDAQFNAIFTPISRELNRRFSEEMELMQARLTNAGLVNTPAGFGAIEKLQSDQRLDLLTSLERASDTAAMQTLDQGVALSLESGRQQTQLKLGQAQLNLTAQVESARNILEQGAQGIQREELEVQRMQIQTQRYLGALGIDAELAIASRDQFLREMEIELQDLQRQDQLALETMSMMLNQYLAELVSIINASNLATDRKDTYTV